MMRCILIRKEQMNPWPVQETHENALVLAGEAAAQKAGSQFGQTDLPPSKKGRMAVSDSSHSAWGAMPGE